MTKSITKKEMFKVIAAFANENGRTDISDFCDKEIAALKKAKANRGLSKRQKEALVDADKLLEVMKERTSFVAFQASDLKGFQEGASTQKVSALLKKLVDSDKVEKVVEKRTSYFFVKA